MNTATKTPVAVDYFYKTHPLSGLQVKLSLWMREKMFQAMPIQPGMRVLEVGCTPETSMPDLNYFSRRAQDLGCEVWVTSIEDCSKVAAQNGWHWVALDHIQQARQKGIRFDAVISSAVIEHVGEKEEKQRHLRFLDDCTDGVTILTTPNRNHWMEIHTKLPLIHWLPKRNHRALLQAIGLNEWASSDQLDLLRRGEFQSLIRETFPTRHTHFKNFWFLGAISNLMAIVSK